MKTNKLFALGLLSGWLFPVFPRKINCFPNWLGGVGGRGQDDRRVAGAVHYLGWRHGDLLCQWRLKTKSGSIFQKQGLNLNLTPGDDFIQQVRDYSSANRPSSVAPTV